MSTRNAIQVQGPGDAKLVSDAPRPKLKDHSIIVKVAAVALNPTDWMHIDSIAEAGTISGCDYAGVVEEVSDDVTNGLKKGDRVAGFTHGGNNSNHETGAFADYIIAKGDVQVKIPDRLSFEEAATLGVGITTVGQGLYQSLGLPLPSKPAEEKFLILIYGGSTATGTLAIQFAKLSNLEVITTSSPHNFPLLKARGADHVFDHSSPTLIDDIRSASGGHLRHVFDCISTPTSSRICAESIAADGGQYSSLLFIESLPRDDVANKFTIAYTALGDAFTYGPHSFEANKEHYDFMAEFQALAGRLLQEGKIVPHPHRVREGGLRGVLEGLNDLREKKVSGEKLVYRVE